MINVTFYNAFLYRIAKSTCDYTYTFHKYKNHFNLI